MWTTMKNNMMGKTFLSCSFYMYRFRKYLSYGFPMIIICNLVVHYETPCMLKTVSQWYRFRITPQTCDILLTVTVLQNHSIRRKNNSSAILYKFESLSSPPAPGKCNVASTKLKPCNKHGFNEGSEPQTFQLWLHSSATLTEVFPCFFLSCKPNARL